MSIKYYQLAKDEELPDEFCAVRDVGGEPSEYTFYVPERENARLRKELESVGTAAYLYGRSDLKTENARLREACAELLKMAERHDHEWLHWPEMHEELRELGVEVDE